MSTTPTAANPEDNNEPERLPNSGDNVRASWSFSLHDVRVNMSKCATEARELMIAAFLWCIDSKHPHSRYDFAKAIGYDPTTVYKIFAGKYTRPGSGERLDVPAKMISATREFLRVERERFAGGGKAEFVLTPTAKKIQLGCDLARESQTPVFIWGVSHIGKTWALIDYCNGHNHGRSPYIRIPAASGLGGMIRHANKCVGNSDKTSTAAAIERFTRSLTPNTLPVFDEVHELVYTYRKASFFACLEVLRGIIDEAGCGAVMSGTLLLLARMGEAKHGELEQFFRRGVHKIMLPDMPTKGDLTAIFEHNGLEFPDRKLEVTVQGILEKPYEVVRQLAKNDGLKAITERLRYARKLATRGNDTLDWKHVVDAHLRIKKNAEPEPDWN